MNALVLIVAALVAVAAAKPLEYHDDVFHFSTKVNHENIAHASLHSAKALPVVQSVVVPQYQQQYVKSVYSQAPQVHHHHHVQQPAVLFRSVEQEVPAVSTVHTHHVHQPVFAQVAPVAPIVAAPAPAPVVRSSVVVPQYSQYSQYSQYPQYSQYSQSHSEPKYKILKQVQEFDPVGIYRVDYSTENGINSAEQGTVKDIQAKDGPVAAKEGSYSYTGPDGVQYTVNWIADEFGFRASGAHLPQVPAEIQRSLATIAAQPQKYDQDGNLIYKQF